jgi:hypothetical protein
MVDDGTVIRQAKPLKQKDWIRQAMLEGVNSYCLMDERPISNLNITLKG